MNAHPLERLLTSIGSEASLAAEREQGAHRLLELLGDHATDRKLRLFAIALCHRIAPGLFLRQTWRGLEVAERLADGTAMTEDVESAIAELHVLGMDEARRNSWQPPEYVVSAVQSTLNSDIRETTRYAISCAWLTSQPARDKVWAAATATRLRDIFGNPFRPVVFEPEWRTSTVVSLAQSMYASRDFSPMPILSDALQDAGCEHEDILNHCRDANGVHVRGCWVVDLILQKS